MLNAISSYLTYRLIGHGWLVDNMCDAIGVDSGYIAENSDQFIIDAIFHSGDIRSIVGYRYM